MGSRERGGGGRGDPHGARQKRGGTEWHLRVRRREANQVAHGDETGQDRSKPGERAALSLPLARLFLTSSAPRSAVFDDLNPSLGCWTSLRMAAQSSLLSRPPDRSESSTCVCARARARARACVRACVRVLDESEIGGAD